jgi:hypothetical protein
MGSIMYAARDAIPSGLYADSGESGLVEPFLQLDGDLGTTYLSPTDVVLPPASLSAGELAAEPGLSSAESGATIVTIGTSPSVPTVLASVTIDVPAPGLVFLTASSEIALSHTNGNLSGAVLEIRSTSTATDEPVQLFVPASAPGGSYRFMAPTSTTYRISTPGPQTFYLLSYACAGPSCSGVVSAEDIHLAAVFVPTEYGHNDMFP